MNSSQTLLDDSTNLVYESTSSSNSASEAVSMMNVNPSSPTLTASVASDPNFSSSFSSSSSFAFFHSSAHLVSSNQKHWPTVSSVVSPGISRPTFHRPLRLPSHSTRTSFAKTVFSHTTPSFHVPPSKASSRTSTSKLAIVNVIPSPHPSHSLNATHSIIQPISSTSSSYSVSTIHTLSLTTQLSDKKETGLFTFITINSYSSEPSLASSSLSLSTSTSSTQPSNSVFPPSAKLSRTKGAILGTFGFVCVAFVLGLITLYYRHRRRKYFSVSTTPQSDRHSFTYSGNGGIASTLALNSGETREITYKGSRRFRFPQVASLSRQPLTLSPPATNSYKSEIHFPEGGSTFNSSSNSRISSPVVLPPSLDQNLGASLSLPPPQYFPSFPSRNSLITTAPKSVPPPLKKEPSTSSTCTTSIFPGERSPPSTVSARTIPQIRLEYVETQASSTVCTPASPSVDFIQTPKAVHSSQPMIPYSRSTFLAPPAPKYTSIVKPAGTTSPPPLISFPVAPGAVLSTKPEKPQELKDPEPQSLRVATFSAKRLTWASTLRANLFNAVQFMNSTPEEEEVTDDRESEISSLFSNERSDSESGKSIAAAAAAIQVAGAPVGIGKAVRSEVKKPLRPQRRTWVVVNGSGTRPESQSVESLSDAYHVIK